MSCCPTPANNDPRRFSGYCPSPRSLSEPLSHSEYLRRRMANNNQPLSTQASMTQTGQGEYTRTLWTQQAPAGVCCTNQVLPAVPAVIQGGSAPTAGMTTKMKGAEAARGTVSTYDITNHTEWNTTYRRMGLAIQTDQYGCGSCGLTGTTREVVPGNPECDCTPIRLGSQ